ncbi:uncharacterized protein LOC119363664 isoform X3 [Triticum dicoccoides]|uniref:uncharacterized protein LOC119363664 isoform X3 n=1 Tax=Triticum dicoccoides TaxID=85692 RepID=UPI00188ED475|nr:uncharacterized protein LOC119363664 isoform X3 [Triticum dicoccoides]
MLPRLCCGGERAKVDGGLVCVLLFCNIARGAPASTIALFYCVPYTVSDRHAVMINDDKVVVFRPSRTSIPHRSAIEYLNDNSNLLQSICLDGVGQRHIISLDHISYHMCLCIEQLRHSPSRILLSRPDRAISSLMRYEVRRCIDVNFFVLKRVTTINIIHYMSSLCHISLNHC